MWCEIHCTTCDGCYIAYQQRYVTNMKKLTYANVTVPQIRPLTDTVYYKYSLIYLLTYSLTY